MLDVAVAARRESPAEIVVDEAASGESSLLVSKGVFSSGDSSYGFELKSSGAGAIIYSDCFSDSEEFDHEIDLETLAREIEEAIGEEIASQSRDAAPDDTEVQTIRAPLKELLNFLIYRAHPELLGERARRQPSPHLEKLPPAVDELKNPFGAEKCDKNKRLIFDCGKNGKRAAVLLHNQRAQFRVHYFRPGVGLVNLSFFSRLAGAEGSLLESNS
jgi:hypothetical protein